MACMLGSTSILPRRHTTPPVSLFDWGKRRKAEEKPPHKYHDIDLPFSRSLGPCVVVGYTTTSFKFGAFNPEGYRSTDDYYDTFDAFLFYWKEAGGSAAADDPVILPKMGGSGAAIFDYARGGPQFGADGLLIGPPLTPVMGVFTGPDASSGVGDLRQAKSRLGLSYAKREDGKQSVFGDVPKATLVEVQVFCCPQIASLY
ncbi:hypothetical protein C4D60_Mb06t17890 [Musa balbisiana]|uniref:TLDc domain-containing protein n=1 Tax=Musa balbisiana TaxID=52838 RepID=A0A4S8INW4_MUSBA|nr:hypothetical protein C4D60_Mb06t17890 [Musa balbisiana]